jgi:hypothetical protein
MEIINDFSEYYKFISVTELLNILENSEDYQPLAVEAAKVEFASRHLSDTEIQEAKETLSAKRIQKEKQREKVIAVETKIKAAGNTFIDAVNPIQSGISTTEKTIRIIVITFGCIFVYQFFTHFRMHLAYLKDIPRFPFESIMYFLPQLLLPVAIVAFWKRKSFGWSLLMILLTFSAVGAMGLLFQALTWKPSGFEGLDNLFPRPSPSTFIIQLVFLIGTIYVLSNTKIREVYSISKQKMVTTLSITAFVTFLLVFAIS